MSSIELPRPVFEGAIPTGVQFVGLGGDGSLVHAVQALWDSALVTAAGGVTFESCDAPPERAPYAVAGIAGLWVQQQPPTGYTAISPTGAATLGASPLIWTIPGGTAGGASLLLGTFPSRRWRMRMNVTTSGVLTVFVNGKV